MVIVRAIEFASTSEADLLPFYGRCHVAYVPSNGVVLGLSKLARVTKLFSRQLQSQQRLTNQILVALQQELAPKGAGSKAFGAWTRSRLLCVLCILWLLPRCVKQLYAGKAHPLLLKD